MLLLCQIVHSFIHSFVHLFIHSPVLFLAHSFIHSFKCLVSYLICFFLSQVSAPHKSSGFWFQSFVALYKEHSPHGLWVPDLLALPVLADATSDADSLLSSQLRSPSERLVTGFLHRFPGCWPSRKAWLPVHFMQGFRRAELLCPGPCEIPVGGDTDCAQKSSVTPSRLCWERNNQRKSITPEGQARPGYRHPGPANLSLLCSCWADGKPSGHRVKPFSTSKETGNGFFMCGGVEN